MLLFVFAALICNDTNEFIVSNEYLRVVALVFQGRPVELPHNTSETKRRHLQVIRTRTVRVYAFHGKTLSICTLHFTVMYNCNKPAKMKRSKLVANRSKHTICSMFASSGQRVTTSSVLLRTWSAGFRQCVSAVCRYGTWPGAPAPPTSARGPSTLWLAP